MSGQIKLMRVERNEVEAEDDIWHPFSDAVVHNYIDFDVVELARDNF